jgi:hypothetical protein
VGPVLIRGPVADALVSAIRSVHPDAQIIDRDAYLRVLVPGCCRLSRSAVEARLGQSFHLPADLEEVMPSFKGRLSINEEEAIWQGRGET